LDRYISWFSVRVVLRVLPGTKLYPTFTSLLPQLCSQKRLSNRASQP
jgi:hypothetical protein